MSMEFNLPTSKIEEGLMKVWHAKVETQGFKWGIIYNLKTLVIYFGFKLNSLSITNFLRVISDMKVHVKIVDGLIGSKLGGGIQLHWTEEYLLLLKTWLKINIFCRKPKIWKVETACCFRTKRAVLSLKFGQLILINGRNSKNACF